MLTIDGSQGEGGGQIVRSSLALSLITGTPFRMANIRAGRKRPGLLRQHLTGLRAAAQIGVAEVEGDTLHASTFTFVPQVIVPGNYYFSVGTAGSALLVLQTILPPLLTASGPSRLTIEGGTHNRAAPPFDFIRDTFLPLVHKMGPTVKATLERYGFFPAGGGRIVVEVHPVSTLQPLQLCARGPVVQRRAKALVANLPRHIAEREVRKLQQLLGWPASCFEVEEVSAFGPGNAVLVQLGSSTVTETFVGFGERGRKAEDVAKAVAAEAQAYLTASAPVGPHLADQLLLPLALAGGGAFRTGPLTLHTRTNIAVIQTFLSVEITVDEVERNMFEISVAG